MWYICDQIRDNNILMNLRKKTQPQPAAAGSDAENEVVSFLLSSLRWMILSPLIDQIEEYLFCYLVSKPLFTQLTTAAKNLINFINEINKGKKL
jgi:hypothetical protein